MSPRTRVKVCGVTIAEDRDAAIESGVDAVGFISEVPVETPREVNPTRAEALVDGVPPLVTSVLVTMPTAVTDTVELFERVGADVLQVHGCRSLERLEAIREGIDGPLVVGVDAGKETESDCLSLAAVADALLVDSTDDSGAGGTGHTHDWERTERLVNQTETPVILAGGLTPENVSEAIRRVQPFAVDVATGVEREGGRKDHEAVEAFVRRTREVPA